MITKNSISHNVCVYTKFEAVKFGAERPTAEEFGRRPGRGLSRIHAVMEPEPCLVSFF